MSHLNFCNNENNIYHNQPKYKFIREHGGWDNWSMIEIEKYPCNDQNEALAKERHWIEQLNANLNTSIPLRSHTEHYQDNKKLILAKQKAYTNDNKDKVKEYKKQYYLKNKDTEEFKQKRTANYEKTKAQVNLRAQNHYLKNKEQILAKRKEEYQAKKETNNILDV
jgi:predicted DNA binding CopG/RHH family protein